MTTFVIDPLGSPEVHFIKGGVALFELAGSPSPGTVVPAVAGLTVVRATSAGSFELSSDFDIGDAIEVYAAADFGFGVILPAGDVLLGTSNGDKDGARGNPVRVRKISATEWAF